MKIFRFLLVSVLSLLTLSASASSYYKTAPYRVLKGGEGFTTDHYVNPFAGSTRSVLNLAVEIEGMQGFRLAVDEKGTMQPATIELQLQRSGNLLVAATSKEAAEAVAWGKGKLNTTPVLKRALRITEVPVMDIYAVRYTAGKQTFTIPAEMKGQVAVVGYTSVTKFSGRDMELETGENYPAFVIEGFS
ncbi:MAG: hypothetical protein IIV28_01945, partial [Alistipes sp.]|nr:hypothetical protein [Alistipes sp.]